jgi:hypothetical protein
MKECDLQRCTTYLTLLTTLVFSGCTSMGMSSHELEKLSPNEGIVIGSVQIKGGQDLIGRTKWEIVAEEIIVVTSPPSLLSSFVSSAFPPLVPSNFAFAIQAHRDGDEEFFFKRMPAGNYRFWTLYQPGFSSFTAPINVKFRVEPGKTTYIGRLFIEFPQGLLTSYTTFKITIQDTKESTLDVARKSVGFAATDVVTDLMTPPGREGSFEASPYRAPPAPPSRAK